MKCLTVKQPWAWLIVNGYKDVENRSWSTEYTGELLIHAGKSFDYDALLWLYEQNLHDAVRAVVKHFDIQFGANHEPISHDKSECGGIVGKVNLVGYSCHSPSVWAQPNCVHWLLEDPEKMEFVPCKGKLGLWNYQFNQGGEV